MVRGCSKGFGSIGLPCNVFFKIFAFLITFILLLSTLPTFAANLSIGEKTPVNQIRVSVYQYDLTYTAQATNNDTDSLINVSATLSSSAPWIIVVDGGLIFGNVGPGTTVTSTDTFTIRVDLRYPFDESYLSWIFSYDVIPSCTDNDGDGFFVEGGDCGPADCDDTDYSIFPGATETCGDGIDQDCDGQDLVCPCTDNDGDGYSIEGGDCGPVDCDDSHSGTYPGAAEICDGIDNDCNGIIDEIFNLGGSCSVGIGACQRAGTMVCSADGLGTVCSAMPGDPSPEVCDGIDNNCDSAVDEGVQNTYYLDSDGDSYGNPSNSTSACVPPAGYVANNTDCNDNDLSIHPGAAETCGDGIDQDCDGQDMVCPCTDNDSDGYSIEGGVCGPVDCDDTNTAIYPGAAEICGDGIDQNCDGKDPGCCTDADSDGFFAEGGACGPKDCDDNNSGINPGAREVCEDGIDQDCNGQDLPCVLNDADGDLWSSAQGDCDDNNPNIFPGATDFPYNGIDEDCNGQDAVAPSLADNDYDGYTAADGDCHDQNPNVHPDAAEIPCNGIDEDCDGLDSCTLTPAVVEASGFIDGKVFDARTEDPIGGATIKMANVGQVQANGEGKFTFPTPKDGMYLILIEKEGYTYAQRRIRVESGHDFAVEPVYLVPIDPVTATITPETGGTLINSTNDVELHFEPGSVSETVQVSATRFYDNRELPGDLPPTSHFTTAVELLPDGLTFDKPVRLLVENTHDFAPGTPIPVGYYRKDLGMWVPDGMGKITDDGKYIEYYITHFTSVDLNVNSIPPEYSEAPCDECAVDESEKQNEPKPCGKAGDTGNSKIVFRDGELMENYLLPVYKSLRKSNSLSLTYKSNSADPKAVISIASDCDHYLPEKIEFKIDIGGIKEKRIFLPNNDWKSFKYLFDGINFRNERLISGSYPYSIELTHWYPAYYGLTRRFGDPSLMPAVNIQGNPIRAPWDLPLKKKFKGKIILNDQTNSSFGAGWNIADLHRIYKGSVVLTSGAGAKLYFEPKNNIIETINEKVLGTKIGLTNTCGAAVDSAGNIYFSDNYNHCIRRIDVNGMITTIAGSGIRGYSGDGGAAIQARLNHPYGVAVDNDGNVYIADSWNYCIRRVDSSGIITTIAGNGFYGYSGDGGPATQARLNYPFGVAVDNDGNVYIADSWNYCIRRVDSSGTITTFTGNGTKGYSGDGGPATQARLSEPLGIAVDTGGNVYISDAGASVIRRVDPSGIITTFAGNGIYGYSGDGGTATQASLRSPYGLAVDNVGNVYIADRYSHCIRQVNSNGMITTVAGNGIRGYSGDGGSAIQARLNYPYGVAVDNAGNVYIAEYTNTRIRRVDPGGIITTIAGNGTWGRCNILWNPYGVAVDAAGNIYIADNYNNFIRQIDPSTGITSTIAGNGTWGYSGDGGPATQASIDEPCGIAVDTGRNVYFADYRNNCIRRIDPGGIITTIAGNEDSDYSGDGGPATQACLGGPSGVAVDNIGNVYIADTYNNCIRRVDSSGIITTIAGNGYDGYSGDGGPAIQATLDSPHGIAVDDDGNIYIADTYNNCIRRINPSGIITTIAGNGYDGYSGDGGPAIQAALDGPHGVAVDNAGNVYIADSYNRRIRVIDSRGIITTIAGDGTEGYSGDGGPATRASLSYPYGVAVDNSGNVYIADTENDRIRMISEGANIATKFISPEGDYSELTSNEDGTYTRTMKDGTAYHFNDKGLQIVKVDTNGQTTTYTYDEDNRVISIKDPMNMTTTFNYNDNNLSSITGPAGRTTRLIHDADNNLTRIIAPDGSITAFTYDSKHLMTSKTDSLGRTTQYNYNQHGMIESVIGSDGSVNQYSASSSIGLINDLPSGVATYNNPTLALPPQDDVHIDPSGSSTSMKTDKYGRLLSKADALGNVTTYERDLESGNLTALHTPNGATIQREYDDKGNLISSTDGEGNTTTYTYESTFNKVKTITDPLGMVTTFDYDAEGNLIQITDPLSNITTMTYYSNGLIHTVTNPNGATTTYEYDSSGNLNKETDALGNVTTYTHDAAGNVISVTDALGRTTSYEYDVMNNLTAIIDPSGDRTTYTYDAAGNRISMADANGNITQYQYDGKDRLIKVIDPLGNETVYTYDNNGNILTRKDPKGAITTYEYNALDQLIKETGPLGNQTTYTYDAVGNRISMTDANGNTTYYQYDLNNRRTTTIDPLSGETTFTYDGIGNLLSVTDAKGNTTTFTYDVLNRKILAVNPLGEQEAFSYDSNGNLIQKTLSNGETITYTYDALSRLAQKTLSAGGTTYYSHDAVDNLVGLTNPYSTLSFGYDTNDRMVAAYTAATSYQPETAITYTYDAVGNRISMTDLYGWFTTYTYDARNNLAGLTTPASQTITFTYDGNSQRVSKILPNNIASLYTYNVNGDLTSLDHTLGINLISGYSYGYDAVRNRTRMTDLFGDHNYTYDELYQLIGANHPQISQETYTYDQVGNRLSSADSANWSYNTGNRLLDDGVFTYQYTKGCLVQKTNKSTGEVTTYSYNSENQLIGITTPTSTITYYYDGLGRRICKEVDGVRAYYIYDDEDIILVLDGSYNVVSHFTHGPGVDEPIEMNQAGATYYYLQDGLGSITRIIDVAGNIHQEYTYDSFGDIVNQTGTLYNPYTYTGREYDPESGLYYYRARYYDARIGKFLQLDPIGFGGGDLNLYRYVGNNPVKFTDPWGLDVYINYSTGAWGHVDIAVEDRKSNQIVSSGFYPGGNPAASKGEIRGSRIKNVPFYDQTGNIVRIPTDEEQDKKMLEAIQQFYNLQEEGKLENYYIFPFQTCVDFVSNILQEGDINLGDYLAPFELYNAAVTYVDLKLVQEGLPITDYPYFSWNTRMEKIKKFEGCD